jgi:uncharacterized protein YjeT (DUF2065 family)
MNEQQLPLSLVWQSDGHLSDIACTALADAQFEILSESAVTHGTTCPLCMQRLAEATMLTAQIQEIVHEFPDVTAIPVRSKLPVASLLLGVALAVVGLIPTLWNLSSILAELKLSVNGTLPLVARTMAQAIQQVSEQQLTFLSWGTGLTLVLVGWVLTRWKLQPLLNISHKQSS